MENMDAQQVAVHPHFVFLAALAENERLQREIDEIAAHAHQERRRSYLAEAKIQPLVEMVQRYEYALRQIVNSTNAAHSEAAAMALGDVGLAVRIRESARRAEQARMLVSSGASKAKLPAWKRIVLKLIRVTL